MSLGFQIWGQEGPCSDHETGMQNPGNPLGRRHFDGLNTHCSCFSNSLYDSNSPTVGPQFSLVVNHALPNPPPLSVTACRPAFNLSASVIQTCGWPSSTFPSPNLTILLSEQEAKGRTGQDRVSGFSRVSGRGFSGHPPGVCARS